MKKLWRHIASARLCLAVLAAGILLSAQEAKADSWPHYWSVFNVEGESSLTARFVTYASPADMFLDTSRTGVFTPNSFGFGRNIVGSGAGILPPTTTVPEPISTALLGTGLAGIAAVRRRRKVEPEGD